MSEYKALYCHCCRRQLAIASPTRVIFNEGAYTEEALAIRCSNCGVRRYWKPIKEVIDAPAAIVYTHPVPA